MKFLLLLVMIIASASSTRFDENRRQSPFTPPVESATILKGIQWSSTSLVGQKFHNCFVECDSKDLCAGKKVKYSCRTDQNRNTAILKFPNGIIFFDAKMGIDADGSPMSQKRQGTDLPRTAFNYRSYGQSVDSDKIPYIVIPSGSFGKELGVKTGDIAAVVFKDKLVFALVADTGLPYKIGEGSIQLHEELGHKVCISRNTDGECTRLVQNSIGGKVLYFIFPHSGILDLSPANAKQKIADKGKELFDKFLDTSS